MVGTERGRLETGHLIVLYLTARVLDLTTSVLMSFRVAGPGDAVWPEGSRGSFLRGWKKEAGRSSRDRADRHMCIINLGRRLWGAL